MRESVEINSHQRHKLLVRNITKPVNNGLTGVSYRGKKGVSGYICPHLFPQSLDFVQPGTVGRQIHRINLLCVGIKKWAQHISGMGRCIIPYQKNEMLIKHLTQRLEVALHLHCPFARKDLVQPFTSGVNNTSQKVFDFILSRGGDSVLLINELIALANVSTPMDFSLIIVD